MATEPLGQVPECALRALTLCDGQVLEDPEHALAACMCDLAGSAEAAGLGHLAELARFRRQELTRRTLLAERGQEGVSWSSR